MPRRRFKGPRTVEMDLDLFRARRMFEQLDQFENGALSERESGHLLEVLGVCLEDDGELGVGDRLWLERVYHRVQRNLPIPPLSLRRNPQHGPSATDGARGPES